MPENMKKTFVVAMREFFGYRAGDTMKEFALELRKLTPGDREDFKVMLEEQAGYSIISV